METFADRFKAALNFRGMKQADIVALTKIGKSSISTYLAGEYVPKQQNLYKIAKALNVSEAWLMGYDVAMESPRPADAVPVPELRRIPVLGAIRAGEPIFEEENIEGYEFVNVPEGEDYYYLRVRGDSMINARICEGDLTLVRQQSYAEDGQIVVCIVNGAEAILKRFYRQNDMIILQPENPEYSPIIVPSPEFDNGYAQILGVVVEVKFKP